MEGLAGMRKLFKSNDEFGIHYDPEIREFSVKNHPVHVNNVLLTANTPLAEDHIRSEIKRVGFDNHGTVDTIDTGNTTIEPMKTVYDIAQKFNSMPDASFHYLYTKPKKHLRRNFHRLHKDAQRAGFRDLEEAHNTLKKMSVLSPGLVSAIIKKYEHEKAV